MRLMERLLPILDKQSWPKAPTGVCAACLTETWHAGDRSFFSFTLKSKLFLGVVTKTVLWPYPSLLPLHQDLWGLFPISCCGVCHVLVRAKACGTLGATSWEVRALGFFFFEKFRAHFYLAALQEGCVYDFYFVFPVAIHLQKCLSALIILFCK